MQACTLPSKPMRQFPVFDLARLLRTVFDPQRGESICILTDLEHPADDVNFAFLQNVDFIIPRKAYTFFYRELHSGVMQQFGLGACDFFAYQTTEGHDRDLPEAATGSDGVVYLLEKDIFPFYDIVLCITTHSATLPLTAASKKHGFRGAAIHGLNHTILRSGLSIDYNEVVRITDRIHAGITKADSIDIDFEIDALTYHLHFDLGCQEAKKNTGICHTGPKIINLPAGEVSFVPVDGSGSCPLQLEDGTIALAQVDRKRIHTLLLIRGNQDTVDAWQRRLDHDPATGNLMELSFGTQVLPFSGSSIQDEKILGTLHFGLGRHELSKASSLHETILFSPNTTPEIQIKQVRMRRDNKIECLIEHNEPAAYLKNLVVLLDGAVNLAL